MKTWHGALDDLSLSSHQEDCFHFLVELTDNMISAKDLPHLIKDSADQIHQFIGSDFVGLEVFKPHTEKLCAHSVCFDNKDHCFFNSELKASSDFPKESAFYRGEKVLYDGNALASLSQQYPYIADISKKGVKVLLNLPLCSSGHLIGVLSIGYAKALEFSNIFIELVERISQRMSLVLKVILTQNPTATISPSQLTSLDDVILKGPTELIGTSRAIRSIMNQIKIVAKSDATVLLLGETGTGKGLIAQLIHDLSDRRNFEMIKMNCTAIPSDLMESELFGHEKGSFTGALARRIGHFEQANKSTLFLDEIGDMPMDLQPKLLSVLQEQQIRRIGNPTIIPIDVRFIAATNNNLPQKIKENRFRSDLFYRLNVFPITVPPLRQRQEDIVPLAKYFTKYFAQKMNRDIHEISSETLEMMEKLPWPGNIRELENVIERAVILSTQSKTLKLTPETVLQFTKGDSLITKIATSPEQSTKLEEAPTHHLPNTTKEDILRVLKETGGQIGGKNGAATRLGLKRTTLLARCKKFHINPDEFRN